MATKKGKPGRPSSFTQEIADEICNAMISGMSLRAICSAEDMPDRTTVLRWMGSDEEFASKCARARILQADALEEEMSDIEEKTLTGQIDPTAARVVLSSKQWRASKLAPKRYGDRLAIGGHEDMPPLSGLSEEELAARIAKLMK